VEANIDLFISGTSQLAKAFHGSSAKGMQPARGWIARATGSDSYEVLFDYTDAPVSIEKCKFAADSSSGFKIAVT
jgi:hypothetical protein